MILQLTAASKVFMQLYLYLFVEEFFFNDLNMTCHWEEFALGLKNSWQNQEI
jgi:hypothetical protein